MNDTPSYSQVTLEKPTVFTPVAYSLRLLSRIRIHAAEFTSVVTDIKLIRDHMASAQAILALHVQLMHLLAQCRLLSIASHIGLTFTPTCGCSDLSCQPRRHRDTSSPIAALIIIRAMFIVCFMGLLLVASNSSADPILNCCLSHLLHSQPSSAYLVLPYNGFEPLEHLKQLLTGRHTS